MECTSTMCVALSEAFGSELLAEIVEGATLPLLIGVAALLAWAGSRLVVKMINRGVGK